MKTNIIRPTVLDLIRIVDWKDVKRALKYYYPTFKGDIEELFEDLRKMRKRACEDPEDQVVIYTASFGECDDYYSNQGFFKTLKDVEKEVYYSIMSSKWSMSFRGWSTLVNLPVCVDTLNHYKFCEIVAHFMWEITFYGNEKQSRKMGNELFKSARGVEKDFKKATRE